MKLKKTQLEKLKQKKLEAIALFNAGFTTREIGKRVGRSHAWVALVVKETTIKDLST
jgi:hypothetical protein